jgi:hypothetical protein
MNQINETMKRLQEQELREEGQKMQASGDTCEKLMQRPTKDLVKDRQLEINSLACSWFNNLERLQSLVSDGPHPKEQGRVTQMRELVIQLSRTLCECHKRLGGIYAEHVDELAEANRLIMPEKGGVRGAWGSRYSGADFLDTARRSGIDVSEKIEGVRNAILQSKGVPPKYCGYEDVITPAPSRPRIEEPPTEKQLDSIEKQLDTSGELVDSLLADLAQLYVIANSASSMVRMFVKTLQDIHKTPETGTAECQLHSVLVQLDKMLVLVQESVPPQYIEREGSKLLPRILEEAKERHGKHVALGGKVPLIDTPDGKPFCVSSMVRVQKPYLIQLERARKYLVDLMWASAMIADYVPKMVERVRGLTHKMDEDTADKVGAAMNHVERLKNDLEKVEFGIHQGPDGDKIRQRMANAKDISSSRDEGVLKKIEKHAELVTTFDAYEMQLARLCAWLESSYPSIWDVVVGALDGKLPIEMLKEWSKSPAAYLKGIESELHNAQDLLLVNSTPATLARARTYVEELQERSDKDGTYVKKLRETGPSPSRLETRGPRGNREIGIVIEGEVGSGKSTLASALTQLLSDRGFVLDVDARTALEVGHFKQHPVELDQLLVSGYWDKVYLNQRLVGQDKPSPDHRPAAMSNDICETLMRGGRLLEVLGTACEEFFLDTVVDRKILREFCNELDTSCCEYDGGDGQYRFVINSTMFMYVFHLDTNANQVEIKGAKRMWNKEDDSEVEITKLYTPCRIRELREALVLIVRNEIGNQEDLRTSLIRQVRYYDSLDKQPEAEDTQPLPYPRIGQRRVIHMTETTLREVMAVVEKARSSSSADASGMLGITSVLVESPYKVDAFEIAIEVLPNTQESCGYKLGATGLPYPELGKDDLPADGEVTP